MAVEAVRDVEDRDVPRRVFSVSALAAAPQTGRCSLCRARKHRRGAASRPLGSATSSGRTLVTLFRARLESLSARAVVRQITDGRFDLRHSGHHSPKERARAMQTPTKPSSLAGLALAVCLIGQLAVVMAGAAAIGWGKTSIENSLQPLAPAFGEVEVGGSVP